MNLYQTLARATGPARLRASLRRLTAPVRTVPAAAGLLRAAVSPLPPSVYGGDLLDLFGDRLRAALPAPPPSAVEPPGRARRKETRYAPPAPLSQVVPWPDAVGGGPLRFARAAPVPEEAKRRRHGAAVPFSTDDAGSERQGIEQGGQAQRHRDGAPTPTEGRIWEGAHGAPPSPGRPVPGRPSVLEKQLSTYWARQPGPPSASGSRSDGEEASAPRTLPRPRPGSLPQSGHTDWPSLAADAAHHALTRRIGGGRDPGLTLTDSRQRGQAPERVEIQNVFHIAAPPSAQVPPEDFAQTLADVLREQARRHGIDEGGDLP